MIRNGTLYGWIALAALCCTGAEKHPNEAIAKAGADEGLRQAFEQAIYRISDFGPGRYQGVNPAQRLTVEFNGNEARLNHPQGHVVMRLTGYGYGARLQTPLEAKPAVSGNRVEYRRGDLSEWYVNDPRGLEQGFTLARRPRCPRRGEPLVIALGISGELRPGMASHGDAMVLRSERGAAILRYAGLRAWDARGRSQVSRLEIYDRGVRLVVEDDHAEYPLVVDPVLGQTELSASDGAANDAFGTSVAVSGTTAVVGAPNKPIGSNPNQGAAYVFVNNGSTWTEQQKLMVLDGAANDLFGSSVAISGNTVVVGAPNTKIGANNSQGAAHVFAWNGTMWTRQAELTAFDGAANDVFGSSVAVDETNGDWVVVGAPGKAVSEGAAYVFQRNVPMTGWSLQKKLMASDGAPNDYFGGSVAFSGNTVVVGADSKNTYQGAAYIFVQAGTTWTQQAELAANDGLANDYFGHSVAASGNTVVIGAFGKTIGSHQSQGAAYIFTGPNWFQQQELIASDGAGYDLFGYSVGISGYTAVVGGSEKLLFRSNQRQGAAYVFGYSPVMTWTEQRELTALFGAAGDLFGSSVSVSGNTVLIGAPGTASGLNGGQGAAFIMQSSGSLRGDFGGNGVPSVALQFPDGSMGVWYLANAARSLSISNFGLVAGPSTGISLVNVADLNGDGIQDLVLRFADGSMGVWYRGGPQGNTITGFAFIAGPIQGWRPVAMADLNNDGHLDLIIQLPDGTAGVWYLGGPLGNQIQGFAPISGATVGWKIVGSADLNADGHPDLIMQYSDGSVGVWYASGTGGNQITAFAVVAGASTWSVVGVADMDGDGHPDLIIRNTDGTLGVWYLGGAQGNQISGFDPITGPGGLGWLELVAH